LNYLITSISASEQSFVPLSLGCLEIQIQTAALGTLRSAQADPREARQKRRRTGWQPEERESPHLFQ